MSDFSRVRVTLKSKSLESQLGILNEGKYH